MPVQRRVEKHQIKLSDDRYNDQPDYRTLPSKVAKWTQKLVDQNFRSFFNVTRQKSMTSIGCR